LEKKSGWRDHLCQQRFIEAHREAFERVDRRYPVFRYAKQADFSGWIEAERSLGMRLVGPLRVITRRLRTLDIWRS
jgi:hypothetical protein